MLGERVENQLAWDSTFQDNKSKNGFRKKTRDHIRQGMYQWDDVNTGADFDVEEDYNNEDVYLQNISFRSIGEASFLAYARKLKNKDRKIWFSSVNFNRDWTWDDTSCGIDWDEEETDIRLVSVHESGLAFELGAEDYVARPFLSTELAARVAAALRRREAPERETYRESFQLGDLAIDYARRRVTLGGRVVAFTETEYRLLCELAVNLGRTVSREHLMGRVWSERGAVDSKIVRAYVKRLRQKLGENAANPTYIFNEPRVGYRLGTGVEQEGADAV